MTLRFVHLLIAAVAMAIGLSAAVDLRQPLQVQIGNGTLLCGDTHVHTYLSFHAGTPLVHLVNGWRRGLDFIVFTEHNRAGGGPWGESVARMFNIPILSIDGEEVTNPKYHINGLGIVRSIPAWQSAEETAAEIHRQGGLVQVNHPTRKYWAALVPVMVSRQVDAVEYVNPGPWKKEQSQVQEFFDNMSRDGYMEGVAWTGVSDVHLGQTTGWGKTCVIAKEKTWAAIRAELEAGRSAATAEGMFYGPLAGPLNANPEAVAKITQEPALWTKVVSHLFFAAFAVALLGKRGPWRPRAPPPGGSS